MRASLKILAGLAASLLVAGALVWSLNVRGEAPVDDLMPLAAPSAETVARGAYLARAGNCQSCHTAAGGQAYAGGRAIDTPFGAVHSSNLTPDADTGIGRWSPSQFWRAMHHGRSKDGRLLYPAFPYTEYTRITRADSDALYAYLHDLPPVAQVNRAHGLRFPYDSQAALAVWRALYFRPGEFEASSSRDAEWNRGAYLVTGLGHCAACHTARNALGATDSSPGMDLAGGLIPVQNWYAPSLTSPQEAGVADWDRAHIVALLQSGVSPRGAVHGPMSDVVVNSTQHLTGEDLGAMARYLKDLPASASQPPAAPARAIAPEAAARGARLYDNQCAQCHGSKGQGVPNAYPPLAGNRAVTMPQAVNLVQVVLRGGFAPATAGNPRPFGMPPFVLVLDDTEIAAVLTHVRSSWGNQASEVTPLEVNRIRANDLR